MVLMAWPCALRRRLCSTGPSLFGYSIPGSMALRPAQFTPRTADDRPSASSPRMDPSRPGSRLLYLARGPLSSKTLSGHMAKRNRPQIDNPYAGPPKARWLVAQSLKAAISDPRSRGSLRVDALAELTTYLQSSVAAGVNGHTISV